MRKCKMTMWCRSHDKNCYHAHITRSKLKKNYRILHLIKGSTTLCVGMYCGCGLYNVWLTSNTMLTLIYFTTRSNVFLNVRGRNLV